MKMYCSKFSITTSYVILIMSVIHVACAADDRDHVTTEHNYVEFKTQLPHETFLEFPKDCSEYLFGKLRSIRRHGSTWQNSSTDCSNCTCDNGDIRCFFHFCNEPVTGYMTPPSTDADSSLSKGSAPVDDENPEEESSGYPPEDTINEEVVKPKKIDKWPPRLMPEKWRNELSAFETSSAPSADVSEGGDDFSIVEETDPQDRSENETYDQTGRFCSKTCKISCPNGFRVDSLTGCLKCLCNTCTPLLCKNKCASGYTYDQHECRTCTCVSSFSPNTDDIIFTDDKGITIFDNGQIEKHIEEEKKSLSTLSSKDEEEINERNLSDYPHFSAAHSSVHSTASRTQESDTNNFVPISKVDHGNHVKEEEPCNTTHLRGCLDGLQKFPVGGTWSRGPCVSCLCVAPGYSECNITQCHVPHGCPEALRYTPEGSCCEVCEDDHYQGFDGSIDGNHASHISSRVPANYLPSGEMEGVGTVNGDTEGAMVNIPNGSDQPYLLFILIPIGILTSLGVLLFAHLWRRNHRDKYNINSYPPEEKQKLRPAKPLNDDSSSVETIGSHLC